MGARPTSKRGKRSAAKGQLARRLFGTWPRRIGALAASGAVAWVVSQAMPALWHKTKERAGLEPGPLQVVLVRDPETIKTLDPIENYEFVVRRPISAVGPPPNGISERGRYRWAKSMAGVDAFSTVVRIVMRGRSDSPVILDNLQVDVVNSGPPLSGTFVTYFGQGAGQPVRYFEINLDRQPPTVKQLTKGKPTTPFPYEVSKSEVEVFDIYAYALRHDVRWRLRLDYTSADKQGSMTFDDHGQPFETTAPADAPFWHDLGKRPPPPQRGYGWLNGKWVETKACC